LLGLGRDLVNGDNYYSEEIQKGWKEARFNGLWGVEVDLLRTIEEKGWRRWTLGYENTSFTIMLCSI
jgi:hypothetical protein